MEGVETYKVAALCTAHLTEKDSELLKIAGDDPDENMVMSREYGFFIKLYSDEAAVNDNYRHGHSEAINNIIAWALAHGVELIEFDRDAGCVDGFPTFDW
jgi:hypothetical protein